MVIGSWQFDRQGAIFSGYQGSVAEACDQAFRDSVTNGLGEGKPWLPPSIHLVTCAGLTTALSLPAQARNTVQIRSSGRGTPTFIYIQLVYQWQEVTA